MLGAGEPVRVGEALAAGDWLGLSGLLDASHASCRDDYEVSSPGLEELIAKRAGVATVVANPFANMAASGLIRPRQLAQDAPLLLVACGLALRSFE